MNELINKWANFSKPKNNHHISVSNSRVLAAKITLDQINSLSNNNRLGIS